MEYFNIHFAEFFYLFFEKRKIIENVAVSLKDAIELIFKEKIKNKDSNQCDQIWRNFTTLAKIYKSLANYWLFISHVSKCWAYFGKFVPLLG